MAIDFGAWRIGIAVGNGITRSATPLATASIKSRDEALAAVAPHVLEWQPALMIVGVPSHADGKPHPVAVSARKFALMLRSRFGRPVLLIDERLSSHAAEAALQTAGGRARKRGLDAMAAVMIAETYLREPECATAP